MARNGVVGAVVLSALWASGGSAWAGSAPIAKNRIWYESLLAARANPVGLQERASFYYRRRLLDKPTDDVLFGDTWFGIGPTAALSPAFGRVGVDARLVPIALLRLTARWEAITWFGTFDQMASWPGTTVPLDPDNGVNTPVPTDYSDAASDALGDAGQTYPTNGWQAMLEARVQAKAGPVAVRNTTAGYRTKADLRDGDTVYYDLMLDVLMPGDGWALNNDADVMYVGLDTWTLGARYTATHAAHNDDSIADQWTHRAGPIIAKKFNGSRKFKGPTAYLLTQWWLEHPYRTGVETSQAVPLVVLGLGWAGDLLPK